MKSRKGGCFPGDSLLTLSFQCHLCDSFQLLVPSFSAHNFPIRDGEHTSLLVPLHCITAVVKNTTTLLVLSSVP